MRSCCFAEAGGGVRFPNYGNIHENFGKCFFRKKTGEMEGCVCNKNLYYLPTLEFVKSIVKTFYRGKEITEEMRYLITMVG